MMTILEKHLYCILPTSAAEAVPTQVCNLLGITMLAPFCSLGLCQTQTHSLFDTPVDLPQPTRYLEEVDSRKKEQLQQRLGKKLVWLDTVCQGRKQTIRTMEY
jgi:hypothetical protein